MDVSRAPSETAPHPELLRLTEIVKRCPDAIVATDARRVVCDLNPAAERLFGWSRDELIGRSADVLIPGEERIAAAELWLRACDGEEIKPLRCDRLRRDGSSVPVEVRLLSVGGDTRSGAAIYRDLSEHRAHERELAAHVSRLRTLPIRPAPPVAPPDGRRVEEALRIVRERLGMQLALLAEISEEELIVRALEGDETPFGLSKDQVIPRRETVCHQLLNGNVPPVVTSTSALPSLATLPVVADGRVRSYVGVPVPLTDGRVWGTLCALADAPRPEVDERDLAFLQAFADLLGEQIDHSRRRGAHERQQAELTAVSALLVAGDVRAGVTGGRSQAVVELATSVGLGLGLGDRELDAVQQVALLHDIGKLAIPDTVLGAPGPLTPTEWELMREHPAIGARMVAAVAPLAHLAPLVRAEHERVDGTGYPDGLSGTEIPIVSRIVFACDAYQAMRSHRPHQAAVDHVAACAQLRRGAGTQFDSQVVTRLLSVLAE